MDTKSGKFAVRVAEELRAERGRKSIKIAGLVTATGLSKSAVLNYMNGARDIPLPAFFALCAALDVSPTVIFERAEEACE